MPPRARPRRSSLVTQLVGLAAGARARASRARRAVPGAPDLGLGGRGGLSPAVVGITCLYRGLAVGRMGVVAPTTGVLAAVIPVVAGVPPRGHAAPAVVAGIALALVAVVLVTRAPDADADRPSGLRVGAPRRASVIGAFNVSSGQFSGDGGARGRWSSSAPSSVRWSSCVVLRSGSRGGCPATCCRARRRRPARHGRQRRVHPRGPDGRSSRSPRCCRRSTR